MLLKYSVWTETFLYIHGSKTHHHTSDQMCCAVDLIGVGLRTTDLFQTCGAESLLYSVLPPSFIFPSMVQYTEVKFRHCYWMFLRSLSIVRKALQHLSVSFSAFRWHFRWFVCRIAQNVNQIFKRLKWFCFLHTIVLTLSIEARVPSVIWSHCGFSPLGFCVVLEREIL